MNPQTPTPPPVTIDDRDERAAARAFLQRAEVRLSTMHRAAGTFLGGSAVLTLLPVIVGTSLVKVAEQLAPAWDKSTLLWATYGLAGIGMVIPILLALLHFTRDVVCFYYAPGAHPPLIQQPKFVLSAISLATDESPAMRHRITQSHLTDTHLQNAVLPMTGAEGAFLFDQYNKTAGNIVPPGRKEAMEPIEKRGGEAFVHAARVMACLGITGAEDRTLEMEVARMELSLARHAFFLRRLILRFAKALLVTLWTAMIGYLLAAALPHALQHRHPAWWAAPLGILLIYAPGLVYWARRPKKWVFLMWTEQPAPGMVLDSQLLKFEHFIAYFAIVVSALTSAVLAGWYLWLMPR